MTAERDASSEHAHRELDEEVDEWGRQSFPASDPPPTWEGPADEPDAAARNAHPPSSDGASAGSKS